MAERVEGEVVFDAKQALDVLLRVNERMRELEKSSQVAFDKLNSSAKQSADSLNSANIDGRLFLVAQRLKEIGAIGFDGFKNVADSATKFQDEMANVNTIARLSEDELKSFSEQVRTTSDRVGFGVSPTKAAAASYEILSANFSKAADAQKVLDASLRLGRAGRAEGKEAADLLTSALNSYQLSAEKSASVSDKLLKTVELGKTTVPELAQSFGLVGSVAASAGVSFDDLNVAISVATVNGVKTSTAMEGMRSVISNLVKPSQESAAAMESLGIRVNGATLKAEGFLPTIDKIAKAAKGNSVDLAKIFPDASGRAFVATLIDDKGLRSQTQAARAAFQGAAGTTDKFLTEQAKSAKAAFDDFKASAESLGISLGTLLLPALTDLAKAGTSVVQSFDKLPASAKLIGLSMAGAATVLVTTLGALIPIGLAIPGLTGSLNALAQVGPRLAGSLGPLGAIAKSLALDLRLLATSPRVALGIAAEGVTAAGASAALISTAALAVGSEIDKQQENAKTTLEGAGQNLRDFGKQAAAFSLGTLLLEDSKQLKAAGANIEAFALKEKELLETRLSSKDSGEIKRVTEQLEKLREKRAEFTALLQPSVTAKVSSTSFSSEDIQKQQDEAKKRREEAFKDDIQSVENSRKTAAQKIAEFERIKIQYALQGDQLRSIDDKIFAQREKQRTESERAEKQARDNRLKDRLQEIQLSKDDNATKIDALKKLQSQFKLDADEKRQINKEIADLEKKADDDKLKRQERLGELRKDQAEIDKTAADKRLEQLKTDQSRGVDTTGGQLEELAKAKKADDKARKEQLKVDLDKEKDPAADKILKQNAAKRQGQADDDFLRTQKETLRAQNELILQNQSEEVKLAQDQVNRKIEILREEAEKGKQVQDQIVRALKEKLVLREQEIRLELDAAKLKTDSPEKIKRLETEAEGKLLDAKRATKREIEATTKAILDQQNASAPKSLGQLQSLEDVVAELNKTNVTDVSKRIAEIRAGNATGPDQQLAARFNLSTPSGVKDLPFSPQAALAGLKDNIQSLPRLTPALKETIGLTFDAKIRLLDPSGRDRDFRVESQQVTLDGRSSKIALDAARLSRSTLGV